MIKGHKFEIEQKGVYERVWREEKKGGIILLSFILKTEQYPILYKF